MAESNAKTVFEKLNLDAKTIENTLANPKVTASLLETVKHAEVTETDKKTGNLLYAVATKLTAATEKWRAVLARYVALNKISSANQLELAFGYLKKLGNDNLNTDDFDKNIGVGVVVTEADIEKSINDLIEKNKKEIIEERYTINFGDYLRKLREANPFADGAILTKKFNETIEKLLGPKTEADDKMKAEKNKKAKNPPKEEEKKEEEQEFKKEKLSKLVARDLSTALNTPEILKKHLEFSGGKVLTRFPPEPNGYLHIGHAKSIRFNFGLAREYGGETYLRYDDTNPEKETMEFITMIRENVEWLGQKPWKTTYASDNFEKLYEFAVKLIKKDKAYVDEQTPDEIHEYREKKMPSPYRNRPIEESLRMFDGMRRGLYEEGKVCLRLKIDPASDNPTMRDPIAYRIRYAPHPHAGDKWCIYPLYDFTHCICDSLENITHSCCTLEFEIRRDLYYWILEQLELYRPFVWEFSRLNVSNTVISKRKLHHLVFEKIISGWDDPRLLTLQGLRRRGVTADAINEFVDIVGVTRRGNENIISMGVLDHCIRKDLDTKAKRVFAVLDPVKVTILNYDEKSNEKYVALHFPKEKEKGGYEISLAKELYVDRSDVRTVDNKDFYGFAPNKVVGLKYGPVVRVKQILTNAEGEVTEMHVEIEKDTSVKPQTYVNWLPIKESLSITVNVYEMLFNDYNPNAMGDKWLEGINKNSLIIKTNAKVHKSIMGAKISDVFQFERIGYFAVDLSSDVEKGIYVFNKTVGLQDKEKQKILIK